MGNGTTLLLHRCRKGYSLESPKNKNFIREEADPMVRDMFKDDLKKEDTRVKEIVIALKDIQEGKDKHEAVILTYDKFLELCYKR